jgi:Tol biopolymer transport system component
VYLETFPGKKVLTWVNRAGADPQEIGEPQQEMEVPTLSPDERLIGVEGAENSTGADVWVHPAGSLGKQRVTTHPARDSRAIWSPDGKEMAFWSDRNGLPEVFITSASPGGSVRPVLVDGRPLRALPEAWSPDGKYLVYKPVKSTAICYAERTGPNSWKAPLCPPTESGALEIAGQVSPDGGFLAYCSDESGRVEIYVRSFPQGGQKKQISRAGGTQPRWSRNGRELFYVERDTLMAVPITTAAGFSHGAPVRLFSNPALDSDWTLPSYDVSRDGRRFVLIAPKGLQRKPAIRVVQNWFAEFRDQK